MSRCQCYKSQREPTIQCPHPAKSRSRYCGLHQTCKEAIIEWNKLPQEPVVHPPKVQTKAKIVQKKEKIQKNDPLVPKEDARITILKPKKCFDIYEQEEHQILDYLRNNANNIIITDEKINTADCSSRDNLKRLIDNERDTNVYYYIDPHLPLGNNINRDNPIVRISTAFGDHYVTEIDFIGVVFMPEDEWDCLILTKTGKMTHPLISIPATRGDEGAYIGALHGQPEAKVELSSMETLKLV